MKKLIPVLLAVSLAANAALIVTRNATPGAPSSGSSRLAQRAASSAVAKAAAEKAAATLATQPSDTDLATLQEKLAEIGLPPELAREVMRSMLWKPYRDRQRALLDAKDAGKPYWQQTGAAKKQLTAEDRAELRALSDQIEARAASLLGEEYGNRAASRYAFLPADKAAAIQRLHRDYNDIRNGVSDETSLFRLPSDEAGRKLLREEQRRDLEAILTPAELAEYDLRYSPAAGELRKRFAALPDSTEAEYKAAYEIAQNLNASKNNPAAQAAAAQQLRELLGAERYATFLRSNDGDYIALQGAAARFDIPASTIDKVYGLRDEAVSLSRQIASDKSLSAKDKQQALKMLANQMRKDVRANLGDEIGNAYLDKNMTWLKNLSDGNVLNASATGKITSRPVVRDTKGKNSKSQKAKDGKAKARIKTK